MEKSTQRRKRLLWLRPLMIVLVLVGLFLLYQKLYYESRDFYAENFDPYPPISLEGIQQRVGMDLAMELYAKGDYEKAIPVLDMVTKNIHLKEEAHLYRGICKMTMKDYWAAIEDLEKSKSQKELLQIAEWYKILAHIALEPAEGLERKEEAMQLMQYYSEQDSFLFKREEVLSLLKEY